MLKHHVDKHRELVHSTASLVMNQLGLSGESSPDSLPVLRAFRDYLETERRKARRRAFLFSTFFAFILLLILGGALFLNLTFLGEMRKDFRGVQQQAAVFQDLSAALKKDTGAMVSGFEGKASKVQKDLDEKLQAFLKARSEVESQAQAQDTRLQQLNKSFEAMETRNRKILEQLEELKAQRHQLASEPKQAPPPVPKESVGTPAPATAGSAPESGQPAATASTILLSIAPRGQDRSVTWRLPVPE